ncbi:hypothetical protein HMPREF1863_01459 [Aedoeadaptatus coxii]|uniref:Uncharacterized protein n=1 Tax=Aedoeadaptatus coxii TaxID=755172 RepID=A0A134ACB3_9FIRM|nr:hypothetical protein HMPREF1863_01459 [Peptoniphilus coxii]
MFASEACGKGNYCLVMSNLELGDGTPIFFMGWRKHPDRLIGVLSLNLRKMQ